RHTTRPPHGQEPDQGRGVPARGGDVPGPPADARVARRGRSGVRGQGSHHGAARRGQDSVPRAGRPQTQEDHRGTYPGRPAVIHRPAVPINIVVPRGATVQAPELAALSSNKRYPHRSTSLTTTLLFLSSS